VRLDRQSEQYAPTGNISGTGVERSLGTPTLDRLQLLIREAVQNAWDARVDDEHPVRFRVQIRTLTRPQSRSLRELFSDLPEAGDIGAKITKSLENSEQRVIELADFHTTGLCGPVRADQISSDEPANFVNYFRNIGSPRHKQLGGGTYGYGKSSGFALSACSTLIGYTQTTNGGHDIARLMAAGVGKPFEHRRKRFTGRHWWGTCARDGVVDPLEKEKAHRVAAAIGLDRRGAAERGTTLAILDPSLENRTPEQAANAVLECLAWFFWPKMLPQRNGAPAMHFEVQLDGNLLEVPEPSTFPPLGIFADAMKNAQGTEQKVIRCERPIKVLGRLGLARGQPLPRKTLDCGNELPLIPQRCSHVALMRPAELVVRYLVGPQIPSDLVEYGGVFICDDQVEEDFAAAEPPAHDDWVPDNLEGHSRTFVRVALRRLQETMDRYANPLPADAQGASQLSLALLGDALGGVLIGQHGERTGTGRQRPSKPQPPGPRQNITISDPEPFRFAVVRKIACALFRVRFSGHSQKQSVFRAVPFVVLEGGSAPEAAGLESPQVLAWLGSNGEKLSQGPDLRIRVAGEVAAIVAVSIPGDCAVGVDVRREGED
jgi:hypothetical protein